MKTYRRVWGVCLMAVGVSAVLLALRAVGLALPDGAVRALGIADLLALPVLAYTTVRLLRKEGDG